VPCRLEQHAGLIAVADPDGRRTIGDLLVDLGGQVAEHGSPHAAITAMLSTGSAGLVNLTLVLNGLRVAAACIEIGGVEYRGDDAAKALREHSGLVPMWGLMEAVALTSDQYNGFFSVYGDASLSKPRHLYWVAGYEDEDEGEEEGGPSPPAREPPGETKLAVASLESPAVFMAKVVMNSRIIRYTRARDPAELHRQARDLSVQDPEGLYRLSIHLSTDETISTFYMNGRPCLMIRLNDDLSNVEVLAGDVIELLREIDRRYIQYVGLMKVDCPECVETVKTACQAPPVQEPERPRHEPRTAKQPRKLLPGRKKEDHERKVEEARPRRIRFPWFRQ